MTTSRILPFRCVGAVVLALAAVAPQAAEPLCRASGGGPAQGVPIRVGAIVGKTGPDDFSSSAAAARAYFQCVNEHGGIHGRPIDYLIEDDKWNPELAAQAAARLVQDRGVVALVGNGSFVEMRVNGQFYERENTVVLASACAVRECFESRNIVSTNSGPLPSNLGAVQWAVRHLGSKAVACISVNTPGGGSWTCDAVTQWLASQGLKGHSVLFDPGNADFMSVLLEAVATGADTMLVNLPAGLAVPVFKAAQEQDLRDRLKWIAPTPLYDAKIPAALGRYWADKVYVHAELTRHDGTGPDAVRWRAVADRYGRTDAVAANRRDTFSQAGFVSANIFVDTLLKMDSARLDRAAVTQALRAVRDYRTDLLCRPWYFGEGDRHLPNHAGMMLQLVAGGFKTVSGCFDIESDYLLPIKSIERRQGIGTR